MTVFQYVGFAIVLVVLGIGLLGPPLLTWRINQLVDRYNALDDQEDQTA